MRLAKRASNSNDNLEKFTVAEQKRHHNNGPRGGRNDRRQRRPEPDTDEHGNIISEKIISINRSSKVVKGGRRFGFSSFVVAGNHAGKVALGMGKASEVADSIRKGTEDAKRRLENVSIAGNTIPHEVLSVYDGARVLLRPASEGTGIIAGKTVRAVVEAAGVKDILSKSLGSKNPANVAKATFNALKSLRLREDIYKNRGLEVRQTPAATETAEEPAEAAAETQES